MINNYSGTVVSVLIFASIFSGNILAQDYYISFAGAGESTELISVKVENLTQGRMIEISGTDVLHLTATVAGLEPVNPGDEKKLSFSPNPMKEYTRMKFTRQEPSEAIVTIHDLTGKKIAERKEFLLSGNHTFRIEGLDRGIYLVSVNSGGFSISGKLINTSSAGGIKEIIYEHREAITDPKKASHSEGVKDPVPMQFTSDDQLKVTGTGNSSSGMVAMVGMMVPTSNISHTFNFVSCTDKDNNYYPVVKIGAQLWMAENLKTTKYSDNSDILNATQNSAWLGLAEGGYCWYNNDLANKPKFGGMYNWAAVSSGKLCPAGWRVPTVDEWQTLTENTGGNSYSGGNLKETGFIYWNNPNEGATNRSGFSARAGGYRDATPGAGYFHKILVDGYWWTSTEYDATKARCTYIHYYNAIIWDNNTSGKGEGISVRCIKN